MKIKLVNLGVLRQAEFELGDLTIICGKNNTGKTYATYALYGFLDFWRTGFSIDIPSKNIDQLFTNGIVELEIDKFINEKDEILNSASEAYKKVLHRVFASTESSFKESSFHIKLSQSEIKPESVFGVTIGAPSKQFFKISKEQNSTTIQVTLLVEKERIELPQEIIKLTIGDAVKDIIFSSSIPRPFIASAERTGAIMFTNELQLTRNRLFDQLKGKEKNPDPIELLNSVYTSYALPVRENVEFIHRLTELNQKESFLLLNHKDVLTDYAEILGGEFVIKREGVRFLPKTNRNIRLTINESSSGVRSLLDLGFYLRHVAQPNDLLMIDEPELDLHPVNQRKLARLFARLTNLGLRIFITTHSDYIIKELNTLIMLNNQSITSSLVKEKYKYKNDELLNPDKIKVYIAKVELTRLEGNWKRSRFPTLIQAAIDPEYGIWAESFDETINEMNRIQKAVLFGKGR
jgi:ABC-type multidrug transport system ATPase subunit